MLESLFSKLTEYIFVPSKASDPHASHLNLTSITEIRFTKAPSFVSNAPVLPLSSSQSQHFAKLWKGNFPDKLSLNLSSVRNFQPPFH